MKALDIIKEYNAGNKHMLKDHKWLQYLVLTSEQNYNLERLKTLKELNETILVNYVVKTLEVLDTYQLSDDMFKLIEETLIWSEVAKGGMTHQRKIWLENGYDLGVHNLGSAEIYAENLSLKSNGCLSESSKDLVKDKSDSHKHKVVYTLIKTHGLIGQYVRGEVELAHSEQLMSLVEDELMTLEQLESILQILNHCIIGAVRESLWIRVQVDVREAIKQLLLGLYDTKPAIERLEKLRQKAIINGEDFEAAISDLKEKLLGIDFNLENKLNQLFEDVQFWYFESALHDFSLEEAIKILLLISNKIGDRELSHISFEHIMKSMYYDHDGVKKVNLYKKRIVENYLDKQTFEMIVKEQLLESPHMSIDVKDSIYGLSTLQVDFVFTPAAQKLIEFCIEAEKSDADYERAVIMLYDFFELRKDVYDRFHNEGDYLETMNKSIDYKKVIIDHITGNKVVDIGPGGGALMDLIESSKADVQVTGLDVSANVIEALEKKKQRENRKWNVKYGDALNLSEYLEDGEVDTIIFCSIIHELFSYIEFDGKRFNHSTIAKALKSAFNVLPSGGRIIIRDGVMTEPETLKRVIGFKSEEGMNVLKSYVKDFEGRQIQYEGIGHNKVLMPVNDAMEFLYTYTWGEDSYVHEINEQFGYFSPSGYVEFIKTHLGEEAEVLVMDHYLQEGYTTALMPKVDFYDQEGSKCSLPDSTCLIVIEKK